jgi:DNA sulfur modification protein DndD
VKITRITISNFRKLRDFNLSLNADDASQLLLINANNGRGKTSLLKAFTWGLFGGSVTTEDFSKSKLLELAVGDFDTFSVEYQLSIESTGETATLRRAREIKVGSNGQVSFEGNETLIVTVAQADPSEPVDIIPDPGSWIEKHLPNRFQEFILFDGEKMSKFFDANVKRAIEKAIREIAKIDLFESTIDSLDELRVRNDQKLARLSGSSAIKLQEELESKERQSLNLMVNLRRIKDRSSEVKSAIRSCEADLKGNEEAEKFLSQNSQLREELTELHLHWRASELKLSKTLFSLGIGSLFTSRSRDSLASHVLKAQRAGKYPADFAPQALESLIKNGTCICGCDLASNSLAVSALKKVIETSLLAGEVGNSLKEMEQSVLKTEARLQEKKHLYKELLAERKRLEDEIRTRQKALADLEPKLEGIKGNKDIISDAKSAISALHREREDLIRNETGLSAQLEDFAASIVNLKKKLDKATASSEEATRLRAKSEYLQRVINQGDAFKEEIIENVRLKLEHSLDSSFREVEGAGSYKTVVTKDFEVLTLDALDREADLSEGQKMIKAYMFSVALRKVIGLSFPLIVDTPVGRMDTDNVDLLSREIMKLFADDKTSQVVMMMHDNEYTPYTKKKFEALKPVEMYLEQESEDEQSVLKRGINPRWLDSGAWKDWNEGRIR